MKNIIEKLSNKYGEALNLKEAYTSNGITIIPLIKIQWEGTRKEFESLNLIIIEDGKIKEVEVSSLYNYEFVKNSLNAFGVGLNGLYTGAIKHITL